MSVPVHVRGQAIRANDVVTHAEQPHHYGTGHVDELRGPALAAGGFDPDRTWAKVMWDQGGYDWLRATELGKVDVAVFENAQRPGQPGQSG